MKTTTPQSAPETHYPSAKVRELFNVSDMTIWRWQQRGILCQPTKICGRNYWPASAIQALIKPKAAA